MRTSRVFLLGLASILCGSGIGRCMFMQPQLEMVPVDRLARNIEQKLDKEPENPDLLFTLARIHSMAYAKKSTEIQVKKGEESPWFGFVPRGIPYGVKASDDKDDQALAKAHLEKAIALHKKVVELKPAHYVARLGLAWCTQQAGRKEEAIKLYRALIKEALPEDRKLNGRYHGLPTISTEASNYLIELLDPKADAGDIAKLKEQSKATEQRIPRMITPIAVALKDDLAPHDFVDPDTSVVFDLDGSGVQRRWQWIDKDAAWLVYDGTGDGKVSSALNMFGSVTFWLFWENGYQALAALDDDADGKLNGSELRHLALWHDRNQNGISETGEVEALAPLGIVALDCSARMSQAGMHWNPAGVIYEDGHTHPSCDVLLEPAGD